MNYLLKFFLRGILQKVQHFKFLHFLTQLLIHLRVELFLLIFCLTEIHLIRLNLLFQCVILLLNYLKLIFGALYHLLQNLNLFGELFLCHLIQSILCFELLLVVHGHCSAWSEFILRNGTGGQGNDVKVVEVHLVILSGHLSVEFCHYHTIKFLKLSACR